jgi:hypothetical protein
MSCVEGEQLMPHVQVSRSGLRGEWAPLLSCANEVQGDLDGPKHPSLLP